MSRNCPRPQRDSRTDPAERPRRPARSRGLGELLTPFAIALALAGACGGGGGVDGRLVAVHNALSAVGLAQTGPISEGSLPEGATADVVRALDAGECYTFVAIGSGGVSDIDLVVTGEGGEEVARDSTHGQQAATQVCPEQSGDHRVVVRMASGSGAYAMSSWSGGVSRGGGGRGATASAGGANGNCDAPIALEMGRPVHGSTERGGQRMTGTCAQGDAPEQVYRVALERRAQLMAVLQSGFDGALYLLRRCSDPGTELACNDDAPDTTRSQIDATLDPGEYFLVVDGYGGEQGEYDLVVQVADLQPVAAICNDAQPLAAGQPTSGTTTGAPNYFQATCAGGAQSGDRVHRLEVPSRSRLRIRQQSDHDGALHVRTDCAAATSELLCNDDSIDQQHSLVTAIVDPGRYYVIADGFGTSQSGNYTLTVDLASETGGGADGEACAAPGSVAVGQQFEIDTLDARDDYQGSCGSQGGPDVVYEIPVRARSRARITLEQPEMTGAVYLQRSCGVQSSEVACTPILEQGPTVLDAELTPGSYFLVVDGSSAESFGSAKVTVQVDDLAALDRSCRQAPRLRPGQSITGSTVAGTDRFQASCAGGARSNDVLYRLSLPRRQIVRVTMSSDYDGALHLRRTCADPTTEIICNDDHNDNRHAFVETTLDAGTYYVVVDGFQTGNAGTFTLDVQTSNP